MSTPLALADQGSTAMTTSRLCSFVVHSGVLEELGLGCCTLNVMFILYFSFLPQGVTYCGESKASTLTMQNVPWHEEVTVGKNFTPLTDSDTFYRAGSIHDSLNSRQGIGILVAVCSFFLLVLLVCIDLV